MISFKDLDGSICAQIACEKGKGTVQEYQIGDGERVVGIYGYMDKNADIRGLGLLVASIGEEFNSR